MGLISVHPPLAFFLTLLFNHSIFYTMTPETYKEFVRQMQELSDEKGWDEQVTELATKLTAITAYLLKPRWRSVDDELPKEDGYYLVWRTKFKEVAMASYSTYYADWSDVLDDHVTDVSHWLPLPTPPEKGGEQ